ncbi:hypothetical protein V6Z11_A05G358300 [Gossypium hirsutum]|uniref:Uncharacterized protein isoform X3 n=1 Tax=Gossypium hirsutum TaxID=3635 RepID=A0A1U8I8P1_GOSHI|nr:uncharacterized protein LOC107893856 isoform X3 [Gossypium hirsutum]
MSRMVIVSADERLWFLTGDAVKKLEERGVVIRFMIGRSANRGDSLDRHIDEENSKTKDFFILEGHEELPKKIKFFFGTAVQNWDAEFYIKVYDNIDVDLEGLIGLLEHRRRQGSAYIGCMKSGEVVSEEGKLWYEPEWWKFGDEKSIQTDVYLVKKKRDDVVDDIGCTSCSSTCSKDCVCRVQCISCSKACRCPESCTNRPFSKEKKTKIVKTELCGWGVEAAEPIKKGDFVIEYIGEDFGFKLRARESPEKFITLSTVFGIYKLNIRTYGMYRLDYVLKVGFWLCVI